MDSIIVMQEQQQIPPVPIHQTSLIYRDHEEIFSFRNDLPDNEDCVVVDNDEVSVINNPNMGGPSLIAGAYRDDNAYDNQDQEQEREGDRSTTIVGSEISDSDQKAAKDPSLRDKMTNIYFETPPPKALMTELSLSKNVSRLITKEDAPSYQMNKYGVMKMKQSPDRSNQIIDLRVNHEKNPSSKAKYNYANSLTSFKQSQRNQEMIAGMSKKLENPKILATNGLTSHSTIFRDYQVQQQLRQVFKAQISQRQSLDSMAEHEPKVFEASKLIHGLGHQTEAYNHVCLKDNSIERFQSSQTCLISLPQDSKPPHSKSYSQHFQNFHRPYYFQQQHETPVVSCKEQINFKDPSQDRKQTYKSPQKNKVEVRTERNGEKENDYFQLKMKKMNEQLVGNQTKKQIRQAIDFFLDLSEEANAPRVISKSIFYELFYQFGTFQYPQQQDEMINVQRKAKEEQLLEEMWRLFSFTDVEYILEGSQQDYQQNELDNDFKSFQRKEIQAMDDFTSTQLFEAFYLQSNKHKIQEALLKLYIDKNQASQQQEDMLEEKLQYLVTLFLELNQGQAGKIHQFRLKDILKMRRTSQVYQQFAFFNPQINKKSQEIDQKRLKSLQKSVETEKQELQPKKRADLLYDQGLEHKKKLIQMQAEKERIEQSLYSFKPEISKHSQNLAKNDSRIPVHEPKKTYKSYLVMEYMKNKDKAYSFKPQIEPRKNIYNKSVSSIKGYQETVNRLRERSISQSEGFSTREPGPIKDITKDFPSNQSVKPNNDMKKEPKTAREEGTSKVDHLRRLSQGNTANSRVSSLKSTNELSKQSDDEPRFLKREQEKNQDLFILNVTLSNKKTYNIPVKKNCNPTKTADIFCYENGLNKQVAEELRELLKKCLKEFNDQQI